MKDTETNMQSLPIHILEEIFSYIKCKKQLRQVCKHFQNVIDNSLKLMSNMSLNVYECDSDAKLNPLFQSLTIDNAINQKELLIIKRIKRKEIIKKLNCHIFSDSAIITFSLLHAASLDFNKLQEIFIDLNVNEFEAMVWRLEYEEFNIISKPEFPSLKSLTINLYDRMYDHNILNFFTNSPNLKKLSTQNIYDFAAIDNQDWELEELDLKFNYYDASTLLFLRSQSSSLKILEIYSLDGILNDVVRILPNLEILRLHRRNNGFFDDKSLISNDKLKELSILDSKMTSRTVEKLLLHYNKIERLCIDVHNKLTFNELALPSLKHIAVSDHCTDLLWRLKIVNLESLTMPTEFIQMSFLEEVPAENLQNVRRIKLGVDFDEVSDVLNYFPALKHLYLLSNGYVSEFQVMDILDAKDLSSIYIKNSNWAAKKSPLQVLSEIGNVKTMIKFYYETDEILSYFERKIIARYNVQFLSCSEPTSTYE